MPRLPAADRIDRSRHIFTRVMDGQSTAEIAAAEGVTIRRIQQIVLAELKRVKSNPANDYKILQIARLEIAFDLLGGEIDQGKSAAVPVFLKVAEQLTALNSEQLRLTAPPWRESGDVAAVQERLARLTAAREIVAERAKRRAEAEAAKQRAAQAFENKGGGASADFAVV